MPPALRRLRKPDIPVRSIKQRCSIDAWMFRQDLWMLISLIPGILLSMITIALQEPKLIAEIMEIAEHEGQSATDFVVEAVERYIALYRQKRIQAETEAWYRLPVTQRQRYAGQYVAVMGGEVVDSDPERLTLYYRLKERFGREPVLIIEGSEQAMPTYHITSARYP